MRRSPDTWDYDNAVQVSLDVHSGNSEYSAAALFIGAAGTFADEFRALTPRVGLRAFPRGLGNHYSLATSLGWSIWDREPGGRNLPGFYWSLSVDYFL